MAEPPPPAIIPRWEWRTFGRDFTDAHASIEELVPSGTEESDELYLLSPDGENVKIRDGLLDIKVLREVDRAGLQRWEPVLKAPFPLSPADVATTFEALRQPHPPLTREAYTLEQFVAELIEPSPVLRAVPVHKRRTRYTIHGCKGELSDIEVDGASTRTIAIELEDQAAVLAAVEALGLRDLVNTSFPAGLRALVDHERPRYAVIDCGTNSIKFHVGEREEDGTWTTLVDRAEITRLGEGAAESGTISQEAIDRTAIAVGAMTEEARDLHVLAIAAVGTGVMRSASNSTDVVTAIEEATGTRVEVISGEEESRLAYLAVRAGLPAFDGAMVVFDTGGGSSQFTFGRGADVSERFSVDVGAVRFTERFGLDRVVSTDELDAALDAIAADLARLDDRPAPERLVGMGGAITNLTAVSLELSPYDPDRVQGAVLDRAEIDRQIELYRTRDADDRRSIVGLQPKRADVILAGACIVRIVMDKLGQTSLTVSDRGLRHGVLAERYAD
jgi:exopolyphosphatase / guanosine-5'-triphosphate,3'-diphosphate pyrophosphatase